MKKDLILAILLLSFISINMNAQENNNKFKYERKVQSFKNLRSGGTILTVAGVCTATIGIYNLATLPPRSDWQLSGDGFQTYNPDVFKWVATSFAGALMMGGGITMTAIGHRKMKFYQQKLDGLTLVPLLTSNSSGFYLSYRF